MVWCVCALAAPDQCVCTPKTMRMHKKNRCVYAPVGPMRMHTKPMRMHTRWCAYTQELYASVDLVRIHIGLVRGAHVHTQSPSKTCTRQAKHAHGRLNVRTAGKMCARPCKCAHGRQNVRTALQMCARPAKCAHGQLNVRTDLRPCAYARGDVHTHCVRMAGVFTMIRGITG